MYDELILITEMDNFIDYIPKHSMFNSNDQRLFRFYLKTIHYN